MPTKLSVNIDHVATIRQARRIDEPDPIAAASIAELAGAQGITAHLREDRRHIQDRDARLLRETIKSHYNLEFGLAPEILEIALEIKPDLATLVPEKREEITTEGGLDVITERARIAAFHNDCQRLDIPLSLFIDPEPDQIKASAELGVHGVELHTGPYIHAFGDAEATERELNRLEEAASLVLGAGMHLFGGHGLNYLTTAPLLRRIPSFEELNIGHGIVTRAVLVGMDQAVRDMLAQMASASEGR